MPDQYKLSSKAKKQALGQAGGEQNPGKKKEKGGFKFYTKEVEAMPIGEKVKVKQVERGGKAGTIIGLSPQKRQKSKYKDSSTSRNRGVKYAR